MTLLNAPEYDARRETRNRNLLIGAGVLVGANIGLTDNLRLISTNFYDQGEGRYLFGQAPDLVVNANGSLSALHSAGAIEGLEATIKNTLLYAYYGGIYIDRDVVLDTNGTTLEGYGVLARRTNNPLLTELMQRLAKDERRHFAFYYAKAKEQLQEPAAQALTRFIIRRFWLPVGGGVKPDSEVAWIAKYVLGDAEGAEIAARIDATIAKLPGLESFRGLSLTRTESLDRPERPGLPGLSQSVLD